ncbi:Hsp20/alpha crystallin family protein [Marinobacter sp. X15-166B]|uniref:Hsp20/alpha crystallin family protein n=1 Tax=Marinobacter sp. X15-166B TaxID=1897620 RepID=UPI00085C6EAC|nr:Hsp20/alpha crystallin family protein [Marinobacter sp. X15-166B]OEY66151.1 heat-shock protein [Marinobacter sp. X15-166B]
MSNLTRWNPIDEFENLLDRYNRHFGMVRRNDDRDGMFSRSDWAPAVDIKESEQCFTIEAELPGMQREDVKVTIHDGVLAVQGERKREEESGDEKHHRIERVYGSFTRRFTLPDNVDQDTISASFKDGILTLTLTKVEPAEPKAIEVEVN